MCWLTTAVFGLVDCISLESTAATELFAVAGLYDAMPADDRDFPRLYVDLPEE